MKTEEIQRWMKLAMRRYYLNLEETLLQRDDRLLVFSTIEMRLRSSVAKQMQDSFFRDTFEIFLTGVNSGVALDLVLANIEEKRKEYDGHLSYVQSEYPNANPYDLLGGYFLHETDRGKMLKQFITVQLTCHAEKTCPLIRQALTGSNPQEEIKNLFDEILQRQAQPHSITVLE